jgi:hypothetical protein
MPPLLQNGVLKAIFNPQDSSYNCHPPFVSPQTTDMIAPQRTQTTDMIARKGHKQRKRLPAKGFFAISDLVFIMHCL